MFLNLNKFFYLPLRMKSLPCFEMGITCLAVRCHILEDRNPLYTHVKSTKLSMNTLSHLIMLLPPFYFQAV